MAATGHTFPEITPSARVYTPGKYPQKEFQGLNGAVTTLEYGNRVTDSVLKMTFKNVTDDDAWEIYDNYIKANGGRDPDTGEADYVLLGPAANPPALAGVQNENLRNVMSERYGAHLRYRYAKPPQITSVFPGRSTVEVELRGYLDAANSV